MGVMQIFIFFVLFFSFQLLTSVLPSPVVREWMTFEGEFPKNKAIVLQGEILNAESGLWSCI